ncbi:MAG: hypothetical protein KatS3mg118_3403 [Paracoccaceae bacterium]|nr:MAG: hypothetical protein KatS3mg118_3403 [Paracoccaceae bacterium]
MTAAARGRFGLASRPRPADSPPRSGILCEDGS